MWARAGIQGLTSAPAGVSALSSVPDGACSGPVHSPTGGGRAQVSWSLLWTRQMAQRSPCRLKGLYLLCLLCHLFTLFLLLSLVPSPPLSGFHAAVPTFLSWGLCVCSSPELSEVITGDSSPMTGIHVKRGSGIQTCTLGECYGKVKAESYKPGTPKIGHSAADSPSQPQRQSIPVTFAVLGYQPMQTNTTKFSLSHVQT